MTALLAMVRANVTMSLRNRAALFWNPRLGAAHVLAGRIAVLKNDCAGAESSAGKALQFDPTDQDALALKRLIDQKCKKN